MTIVPLAGICSYKQAANSGLSVETTINRLRRYVFIHTHLVQIIAAHLNGVPEWEVKGSLCLHLWQNAEHGTWMRHRVTEMRTPPHHLDKIPDDCLSDLLDEVLHAENTGELLAGLYELIVPELISAMETHIRQANPIADYPTIRLLKMAIQEKQEQLAWARPAMENIKSESDNNFSDWLSHLRRMYVACGGVHGGAVRGDRLPSMQRRSCQRTFNPVRVWRRDGRFDHLLNSRGQGVSENALLEERMAYMSYIRLTEVHVPELIALVIYEWRDQPWEFYRDLSRHLWDEARHSMMGEAFLGSRNIDFTKTAQEISFAAFPNTELPPYERYALLWGVEQGLMSNTGKVAELKLAQEAHDELMTTFQDFDWADEVLHAQIGRRWLLPHYDNRRDVLNEVYEKVKHQYANIMEEDAQVEGYDWWPQFYETHIKPAISSSS